MTSKADKLPLETELVARDNNTILTLKPGEQIMQWDLKNTGKSGRTGNRAPVPLFWKNHCVKI